MVDFIEIAGLDPTTSLDPAWEFPAMLGGGTNKLTRQQVTAQRYRSQATNYSVALNDHGTMIECTAALTLTLPTASMAREGFTVMVKANGGAVTLDPNGAELINGAATLVVPNGATVTVICTGAVWFSDWTTPVKQFDALNSLGTTIVAAATTNLAAATGDFIDVSGNTTITSLGSGVAGMERTVRFTGAPLITHSAALLLPGAANVQAANGDVAVFRCRGTTNWICTNYEPVNGGLVTNSLTSPSILGSPSGQLITGLLFGLTLSNHATDLTNDLGIAPGVTASDDTVPVLMSLATALRKQTDAPWAVGDGNGGWLDGASMPNGTGHAFLIRRPDTGVVDVGFSASVNPTLPTNYTQKRRIGSFTKTAGTLLRFKQYGDLFKLEFGNVGIRSSSSAFPSALLNVLTPLGIVTRPILTIDVYVAGATVCFISMGDAAVGVAHTFVAGATSVTGTTNEALALISPVFATNLASQIYFKQDNVSGAPNTSTLSLAGWIDTRGREA